MKPLVSICIPNYNGGRYIRQAIDSALSQTYRNTEVVIIDNASTDNSWSIIKSYGKKIRKFRQKANMGYNRNLNTCIELARGKYMKILHSDDLLEKDAVSCQVDVMEKAPSAGFVYGTVNLIDETGEIIGTSSHENVGLVSGRKKLADLLEGNHIMFPSVMVRKECFYNVGFFDGEIPYCNDWDIWMRICMKYDAVSVGGVSASYRTYSQSGGTVRYEMHDISGFQMYRCLTKILSMAGSEGLKKRNYYYKKLAKEQVSRGLSLVKKGRKDHGRRYIMAASSVYDGFFFRLLVYFIYMLTYAGMSGFILKLGRSANGFSSER